MKRPWLAPLAPLYAAGVALRNLRLDKGWEQLRRLSWPVVSIGNLSTGGAGKTPLTIALAQLLHGCGFHVDVLSRGYGRCSTQAVRVQPEGTAEEFGDEPLLMAQAGIPVYVARGRYQAGLLAEADRSAPAPLGVHLLDDGFQHRQLARDVDILLLNREDWHDTLLPAGNLREPLRAAARADVLAIPAQDPGFEADLRASGLACPIWRIRRHMDVPDIGGPIYAFCGIARPKQFFAGLEQAGMRIASRRAFRDHYNYTAQVVEWLLRQARAVGATALLTTEKDAVRLGSLAGAFPPDLPLLTAALTLQMEDAARAVEWLEERLAKTHLAQAHRNATIRQSGPDQPIAGG